MAIETEAFPTFFCSSMEQLSVVYKLPYMYVYVHSLNTFTSEGRLHPKNRVTTDIMHWSSFFSKTFHRPTWTSRSL